MKSEFPSYTELPRLLSKVEDFRDRVLIKLMFFTGMLPPVCIIQSPNQTADKEIKK